MLENGGQQVHAVPNPSYSSSIRSMNSSPAYSMSTSSTTNTQVVSKQNGKCVYVCM